MPAAKTLDEYIRRVLESHSLDLCTWPGDWNHEMAREIVRLRTEVKDLQIERDTYWDMYQQERTTGRVWGQ